MSELMEKRKARMENAIYSACIGLFENMECDREIVGNGHHLAQEVVAFAGNLVKERWHETGGRHEENKQILNQDNPIR